jgi:2-polyprenyl-3-methyl-5-hydroxy-6-metoxy-1,4-benzoquinol methylase
LCDKFKSIALIDTSEGMIHVLNSKIKEHKVDNMKTYVLDINKDRDKLEKYDVIYASIALHHVLDIKTTVETFFYLLNPKGQLCIVDLDEEDGSFHGEEKDFNGHNGFNQEELSSLLRECGFKEISSRIIYSGEKVVGNKNVRYSLFLMKGEK